MAARSTGRRRHRRHPRPLLHPLPAGCRPSAGAAAAGAALALHAGRLGRRCSGLPSPPRAAAVPPACGALPHQEPLPHPPRQLLCAGSSPAAQSARHPASPLPTGPGTGCHPPPGPWPPCASRPPPPAPHWRGQPHCLVRPLLPLLHRLACPSPPLLLPLALLGPVAAGCLLRVYCRLRAPLLVLLVLLPLPNPPPPPPPTAAAVRPRSSPRHKPGSPSDPGG